MEIRKGHQGQDTEAQTPNSKRRLRIRVATPAQRTCRCQTHRAWPVRPASHRRVQAPRSRGETPRRRLAGAIRSVFGSPSCKQ